MNIFYLDNDITKCAQYHANKHVVKMIVEYTQLLSTTCKLNGISYGYKACYVNHPCALWTNECYANFNRLYCLALELCKEYTFRYGKIHKSEEVLKNMPLDEIKHNMKSFPDWITPLPQCMPDDCKVKDNAIEAYRKYYLTHKKHLLKYKNREVPEWVKEIL